MNNGDDTAYYLSRGFRVLAIEANPLLVEQVSRRFVHEIASGALTIVNVGVSDSEGALPFWICDTHPEWSSFDRSVASRDNADHHQVIIPCRRFQSILKEFGSPYYLKLDIEGSEIYCLRDLIVGDPPKYVSFEKTERWTDESLTLLHNLGYTGFKLISQSNYLALEYPPSREQSLYENAQRLLNSKNLALRIIRKAGARRLLQRQVNGTRSWPGWTFPLGSSGPFGEDLRGRWQTFDEIVRTLAKANSAWAAKHPSVFWGDKEYSFWADFHVKRDD
jgi:FkbM family methyltransferase